MKKEAGNEKDPTAYLKNSTPLRLTAAGLLSFAGACALPFMLHIEGEWLGYTNSIISVFVFLFLFWFLEKVLKAEFTGKKRRWFFPGCFGVFFSLCMVFGTQLDLKGSVPFQRGGMWAGILVLSVIFTLAARYFWDVLEKRKAASESADDKVRTDAEAGKEMKTDRRRLLLTAGVILLCYIPVFLAVYPGFFVYDAQDEYLQVVTRNFSTHHPLLHVLLLGGIIQLIFKLTGSYNLGIACYTVFQMTAMSFVFGWCVEKLRCRGMTKRDGVLLTLYFGLCPVLVMFSLCSAKDGLFTGMLLIMVVLLQELCKDPERFLKKKGSMALLGTASLLMMLLRHNGVCAFFVFVPILIIFMRKHWKKLAVYFAVIAAAYLTVNTALTEALCADASENQEILTVPISQMARVYADQKDSLPDQDKEILYRYLSDEALNRYTPKVSDGVKINFNNEAYAADKASFLKLWLKWGAEHPFTYLNAWFMTSYGFWYPDTVIDVYRGNAVFTYTYEDSSYFGYEVEQPGTRETRLPWLNELYRRLSLEITQQKIPVISMLFSPGFLFWIMAFILGFLCYQRKWSRALPYLFPLLCFCTVILGPTYLVRYVVYLWALVPLLLRELMKRTY